MDQSIDPSQWLSSADAAARLGVRRETLYSYVSRGFLHPRRVGRTSVFDPAEVEALRVHHARRRRGGRGGMDVPIPSRITRIEGELLWFRGYRADDLVRAGCCYEQVAELLWSGALPERVRWSADPELTPLVERAQARLPPRTPVIDRLRLTATLASATDATRADLSADAVAQKGRRLLCALVTGLPVVASSAPRDSRGLAARLWPRLASRRRTPGLVAVLDAAMVLLADHELATATVGARVAASTRADPYSVVQAGLGVAAGALHGTAPILAYELLHRVAVEGVPPADALARYEILGESVPGFGHVVYQRDPRAPLLLERLAAAAPAAPLRAAHALREAVLRRTGLEPNVDFGLAALAVAAGMDRESGSAVFTISRCAGWLAHAMEEWTEAPLRFRLSARYLGPRGTRVPGR